MGLKKATTSLEQVVIKKAGGCAVVDGGFATQLERHGAAINDPLWSALCLIKDPHLIKQLTNKAIVVYPNSGEVWDGRAKRWLPSKCFDDDNFEYFSRRWRDSGASLIGGYWRTTPSTIEAISKAVKENP